MRAKKDYYNAMRGLQWFLPAFRTSVITKKFLLGVRDREIFALKNDQIQILACVNPPPLVILQEELVRGLG